MKGHDEPGKEKEQNIVFQANRFSSVQPLIEQVKERGWKKISVDGDNEYKRAVWFEGSMHGIEVKGYSPSPHDADLLQAMKKQCSFGSSGSFSISADKVYADYTQRIIPQLNKEYRELSRYRTEKGISTTELDRAYGLNMGAGYRKDLDDRYFKVKHALLVALEDKAYFAALGTKSVTVRQNHEEGVLKMVPVNRNDGLRQVRSQRRNNFD